MTAFRVLGIDHIVLRCTNLPAMMAFYCGTLGFEVAKRNEPLGLVHLRSRSAMIDLVSLDGPLGRGGGAAPGAEGRNLDHLCLRVDPFDAAALMGHFEALGLAPAELRPTLRPALNRTAATRIRTPRSCRSRYRRDRRRRCTRTSPVRTSRAPTRSGRCHRD